MEQLQRQQGAKMDMNLQEKHLLQAQLLFAQHAAAAARASGSRLDAALFGKADGQSYPAAQQVSNALQGRIDPQDEDEDSDDEEEQDTGEPEDNDEMEEEEGSPLHQQAKKPRVQQVAGLSLNPYSHSAVGKQLSASPPSAIKQELDGKDLLSPAGQPTFTPPNGFTDWGYEEALKQVRVCVRVQIRRGSFLASSILGDCDRRPVRHLT